jgi:MFS family permease
MSNGSTPVKKDNRADHWRGIALHAGGLLGPLGGGIVATMLPELAQSLHTSLDTAGSALTAYFVPFAAVQLISGTAGERWGRRRTVRAAYVVYVLASLLCAAAPDASLFLAGRALQGIANAFTTPLLVAGLAELVPGARLSRSIGVFGSFQAAGQSLAPVVGAASNAVSWRWAFVLVAGVSVLLALAPPPGAARPGAAAPAWRPLFSLRMALISFAALTSYLGAAGLPFLVALYAERRLAVPDTVTGVLLLGFGVAGLALATVWGIVCERYGAIRAGAIGLAVAGLFVAAVAHTSTPWLLAIVWACAGAGASLATVALQNVAALEVPGNRGGALSITSALRFTGAAIAPLVLLPLYPAPLGIGMPQGATAFTVAGIVALAGAAALLAALLWPKR